MAKKQHSVAFQALSQARIATHARDFFEGYVALVIKDPSLSSAFDAYGDFFSVARKAMREMAIINTATVLDKQETSTGMLRLIADVRKERLDLTALCDDLERRLNEHRTTFRKAVLIRSNIVAHRSKQMTFKQVYDNASLDDGELAQAIDAWRTSAQELSVRTRGEPWRVTTDPGGSARRLLNDIGSSLVRPKSPGAEGQ